jgi:hypothetical protein
LQLAIYLSIYLANSDSKVVELLPDHLEVKGLCSATAAGTESDEKATLIHVGSNTDHLSLLHLLAVGIVV